MTDFSNSVIMPREDFIELQTAAWDNDQTVGDRALATLQTTLVFTAIAGCVAASSWAYAKAMNWKDEKAFERAMREANPDKSTKKE